MSGAIFWFVGMAFGMAVMQNSTFDIVLCLGLTIVLAIVDIARG